MELSKLIEDVARQRSYLEILKADSTLDVESLNKCDYILTEMGYSLDDLSNAWVPSEPGALKALLARTVRNLDEAREMVNDGVLSVDPSKPDHLLRLNLAFTSLSVLDMMIETLLKAWAQRQKPETVN